ncbi:MAG: ArnT family glycosyltransferase [Thiobacillus sp.]
MLNIIRLDRLGLLFVCVVFAIVLLRDIGNSSIGYPDADRFMMDGVFILDFLREMPLTRIYDFTIRYYAQYPALSVGYHPPFFPLVEALFNGVLGINTWSSRLAVLAFALMGVVAWYKLTARIFDHTIAFWSSLLLATTPFVVQWGWYTMSDVPLLSMVLVTGYVFYRYTETDRPAYLYLAALLFGIAVWTKQTAVFMAVWFALYALLRGKARVYLQRKECWLAIGIGVLIVAPLAVITVWLGKANIAQSVGPVGSHMPSRLSWHNLSLYPTLLATVQITPPILVLSSLGLVLAAWKRDARMLYFILLIAATYLFFTFLLAKEGRYTLSWVPVFCLAATLPMLYLRSKRTLLAFGVLLGISTIYQVGAIYSKTPEYATGYEEAARYVLLHNDSPIVFFDGFNNGYFTYFMRQLDPKREMYVLRGDKLLSSSAVSARTWLKVHAQTPKDIRAIFDKYGIVLIVVERESRFGIPIHQTLRDYLKSDSFRLVKTIPVESNRSWLKGQQLLVYQYLTPQSLTATSLELDLPVVGKTIKVPMRK